MCIELEKGAAPKHIIDDSPTDKSDFIRVRGCSIPAGTLFVGGDTAFRESLGFKGDLAGDMDEDIIRNRLELAKLSESFKELQMTACQAMYEDDPVILNEWKEWTKLDMLQESSKKDDEGFIVWIKDPVDSLPIPQKIFPPAPVMQVSADGSHEEPTLAVKSSAKSSNHPSIKTAKAAHRTLDLLTTKRVERGREFTDDCFVLGRPSILFNEEIDYCEFLTAGGSKDGLTAYRFRK